MTDTPDTVGSAYLQVYDRWLRFSRPDQIVTVRDPAQVNEALTLIEHRVEVEGFHAVGYLSYDAGCAYGLTARAAQSIPCLWFGLYRTAIEMGTPAAAGSRTKGTLGPWEPGVSRETYLDAIGRVKELIEAGDTYQINYTFPMVTAFTGDPSTLFGDLVHAQEAEYAAYIDTGRHVICSVSPELFFRLDGDGLISKPMKGTASRGMTLAEDRRQIESLYLSEKDRAENLMIVDMIRNDMGRVAEVGSVTVDSLFDVERYPTLLQMTSTVRSRCVRPVSEIIAAMFPCASITGAPKHHTMELIAELEPSPRGIYTGAIGYLGPGRKVQLNVAIRTLVVDREEGRATYNVGSGIVWDSDPASEYDECLLKGDVLLRPNPPFQLLETLLWSPEEGYSLLDEHLERLSDSAEYFAITPDVRGIRSRLHAAVVGRGEPVRVRLLVDQTGDSTIQISSLGATSANPVRIAIAADPVNSQTVWLYHKTTRREIYEKAAASRPDCDDVLLWNERGEITEATIANVVVKLDGRLLTAPVSSGLLAGTMRRKLLAEGAIEEAVIPVEHVRRADEIWLINSVRKWRTACLVS